MPPELQAFLRELEVWVQANAKDARNATRRFWALKAPAALAAAASSALALGDFKVLTAIAGAIATLCIIVDGVNPGGNLRNAFVRAVSDLRTLQNRIVADWRIGALRHSDPSAAAADILERSQTEYRRIAEELRTRESAFASKVG